MSKKSGIFALAALLWGLFIFFNSLQTGEVSTQMSDAVVFRLPDWLRWIDLDTLIMLVLSTGFGYLFGIPLGVVAYITDHGSISENRVVNTVVGWVINIVRSIPFIILILFLIPYTRFVMGTASGTRGVIFPLVVSATPFIARMVESSFNELDQGVIESARAMGATNLQIIWKVLLPESFPSLLRGMAIATITIIGYIAMAGMVGGGGLGAVAINYGYYRYERPVMNATIYTCILLISWFGAKMIVSDALTTGELMSLLTYCMNILMSLMMLSMVFVMLSMSAASAERISEVLREQADLEDPEHPILDVADGSVEFRDVDFAYHKEAGKPVLKGINLSIRPGETIGIIGGTGSAKTSLVNLISRLYDVTSGQVLVGGRDVREYSMEALRNQVSVVLQKNVLFSGSILDNLRWGDENATEEECVRACQLACADEFIQKMPQGYATHIEQGGANVSGGQKQRLCIARALLKKPKILILDDSTSAVDTATDAKIREAFASEIPDTTKFIIAQRVSSVAGADRILVLEDGRVDGFDTHENLLKTNAIYRDVYQSQTGGGGDFDEGGAD